MEEFVNNFNTHKEFVLLKKYMPTGFITLTPRSVCILPPERDRSPTMESQISYKIKADLCSIRSELKLHQKNNYIGVVFAFRLAAFERVNIFRLHMIFSLTNQLDQSDQTDHIISPEARNIQ